MSSPAPEPTWEDYATQAALSEAGDPEATAWLRAAALAPNPFGVPYNDLRTHLYDVGERKWFAEGAIEGNAIVMLAGPEKKGKSWLAMQLAAATVTHGVWLDEWPVVRGGSVVYLDSEYGPFEFARRMARLARGMGEDPEQVVAAVRHIYSSEVVFKPGDTSVSRLLKDLAHNQPSLIVVDPLRNHLDGSESDSDVIVAAFRTIAKMRDAAQCPVMILHHVNKGGKQSGSRAIPGRADLIIEGTDAESPCYSSRGRTIRPTLDSIATPFTVRITHRNDDDDTKAATIVTREADPDAKPPAAALRDTLRALLADGAHSITYLSDNAARSRADVSHELAAMVAEGEAREARVTIRGRTRDAFELVEASHRTSPDESF